MSDSISEAIIDRKPGSGARRLSTAEDGNMRQSALRPVFGGGTTLHEINRVAFVEEPECAYWEAQIFILFRYREGHHHEHE